MGEYQHSRRPGQGRGLGRAIRPAALVGGLALVIAFTGAGHRAAAGTAAAASCPPGTPERNVAAGGFICPVEIPGSAGLGEPSIMSIAGKGTLDVAWYGDPAHAVDPNTDTSGQWNLYYARVTHANTPAPSASPKIAIKDMHNGCIQTGGGASCPDRSLLHFFQITDVSGHPNIIYTAGDTTAGVNLWFTKH